MDYMSGYFEMFGAHIALCMKDYVIGCYLFEKPKRDKSRKNIKVFGDKYKNYSTAKTYLYKTIKVDMDRFNLSFNLCMLYDRIDKMVSLDILDKRSMKNYLNDRKWMCQDQTSVSMTESSSDTLMNA